MPEPPSSPAAAHVDAPSLPDWVRRSKLALLALILAVLPFGSWGACASGVLDKKDDASFVVWILTCVAALVGVVLGVVSLVRLDKQERLSGKVPAVLAIVMGFVSPVVTFVLGFLTSDINFGHGRALRKNGKSLVAGDVDVDAGWLRPVRVALSAARLVDDADAAVVAAAWRQSGATEAASVTAFVHLAADLEDRGAPRALVDAARDNAADEEEHARLCYSVAAAIDGACRGPGVVRFGRVDVARVGGGGDLVEFARANVVESCLFEGAAADVAAVLAARDDVDDDVRAVLAVIAADEARHAGHGWDIVDWCCSVAGDAARGARVVDACVAALQKVDASRVVSTAPDGLERHGVAGPQLWRAALVRERARCLARLATRASTIRSSLRSTLSSSRL